MRRAKMLMSELSDIQKEHYAGTSIDRKEKPSKPLWGYQLEIIESGTGHETLPGGSIGSYYRVYAEELDGFYVLLQGSRIFGISDTETEADRRMRERLERIKKRYEDCGFEVEFESAITSSSKRRSKP
jgi:hypothetical protein